MWRVPFYHGNAPLLAARFARAVSRLATSGMAVACRPRGLAANLLLAGLIFSAILLSLRHIPRLLTTRHDVTNFRTATTTRIDDVAHSITATLPDYSQLAVAEANVLGTTDMRSKAEGEWERDLDRKDVEIFRDIDRTLGDRLSDHQLPEDVTSASPDRDLSPRDGVRGQGERWLVYLCDDTQSCGGWGDRQRGIVSSYLLAIATKRRFAISMTSPCNLDNFYLPNLVRWRDFNVTRLFKPTVRVVDAMGDLGIRDIIKSGTFNQHFPQTVVYIRINQYLYNYVIKDRRYKRRLPEWTARVPHHIRFRRAWTRIFLPAPDIAAQRNSVLAGGRKLVCAHVRMGRNPTMPNDGHARNSWTSLHLLWDFLRAQLQEMQSRDPEDEWKVFVATDSEAVRHEANVTFQSHLVSVPGEIIHIDRQRHFAHACNGFRSAILDQLILTSCHVLVASRSGFSVFASYLRPSTDRLYMFEEGTVSPFNLP